MTAFDLMAPTPPPMRLLSATQLTQAVAGTVLATAIISSASGVFWLVSTLPTKLADIDKSLQRLGDKVDTVERVQREHERRLVILEAHKDD